jgi:hypothetical protein
MAVMGPAHAVQKAEPAAKSQLAGIPLPDRGKRVTDRTLLDQVTSRLDLMASKAQKRSAFVEVLVWPGDCDRGAAVKSVADAMRKAGYSYEDQQVKEETVLEARVLAAEKPGTQTPDSGSPRPTTFYWHGAGFWTRSWTRSRPRRFRRRAAYSSQATRL